MLATLGTLYRLGVGIDWRALYPAGGRVVLLPTYAWEHQRYWLDTKPSRALTRKNASWPGKKLQSPLLTGTVFETHLSAELSPWVEDHRINGSTVVAGAGHLSWPSRLFARHSAVKCSGFATWNSLSCWCLEKTM
jgi:acyl transferase domain-containing protein